MFFELWQKGLPIKQQWYVCQGGALLPLLRHLSTISSY
jgi:hypothetical protein